MSPLLLAQRELARRELARRSLLDFTCATKPGYEVGWIHREVTDLLDAFVEAVERRLSPRLIVELPPRHGKSEIVSRRFPAYLLGKHPEWEVVCATYNQDLADDLGRDVRALMHEQFYNDLFPQTELRKDSNSVSYMKTPRGGSYTAVGIGGALTGRGLHVGIIDDPVKNREDADSELMREATWKWYQSVFRTRAAPGAGIVVLQCMVGSTRVSTPTGTTALRDIHPGDEILTYDQGEVATTRVRKWKNCGPDFVLAIRTTSGTIVRANERHPFLVARPGGPKWVRLRNLLPGDRILRATGENGAGNPAPLRAAISPPSAEDSARVITAKLSEQPGCATPARTPSATDAPISSTATESPSKISTPSSQSRAASAPCADSPQTGPTSVLTGKGCASITATTPNESEDSSATTAISPSAMERPPRSSSPLPTIFVEDEIESIFHDGYEDVYDIEVERTENFIANGLVSHNTRWHEDDLAGKIQLQMDTNAEGDQWKLYSFPAIAIKDEVHRKEGEALHPERWSVKELLKLKNTIDAREWSALYQQNPVPLEGIHFKREWMYWEKPDTKNLNWYLTTDFAIGEKSTSDYTVLWPFAVDENDNVYFGPPLRGRWSAMEIVEKICDLCVQYKVVQIALENVHISKTLGPYLKKRMHERRLYPAIWDFTQTRDKVARSSSLRGRMQQRRVFLPPVGRADIEPEFLAFPAGRHDDLVDAASCGMLMLDTLMRARPDAAPKPSPNPEWSMAWMKERIAKKEATNTHVPPMINGRARPSKKPPAWTV